MMAKRSAGLHAYSAVVSISSTSLVPEICKSDATRQRWVERVRLVRLREVVAYPVMTSGKPMFE